MRLSKLLERGIPLMMEKPPGLNPAETRRMIDAAAAADAPNQVAFNRRYHPLVQRLCAEVRALAAEDQPILTVQYEMLRANAPSQALQSASGLSD